MANEDREYLAWLRLQDCQAPEHVCAGPHVAHHPTHLRHTGHDARKAHDHHAVTLCDWAHRALHGLSPNGPFAGYRRPDIRAFCEEKAGENRARFEGAPVSILGAAA